MNTRRTLIASSRFGIVAGAIMFGGGAFADDAEAAPVKPTPLKVLHHEAAALKSLVETDAATAFLKAVADLPTIEPRVVYYDQAARDALSEAAWGELDEDEQAAYERTELGEHFYYNTRYGTPLAYVRSLELTVKAGLDELDGKRLFDFGYGTVGHLRLLASLGADVVGVEVDPLLREIYAFEGDTGDIPLSSAADDDAADSGSITLHHGFFPADPELTRAIGDGYDLFVSKNTLKKGYIHPEREVDPRMLVHLGVDDRTYIRALYDMLKPGGYVMIYNLYPAPAADDEPYKPWADGRSPFNRSLLEQTGFDVIAYNADDTAAARDMAKALGWDAQMNLETDLFAMYTLLRRR